MKSPFQLILDCIMSKEDPQSQDEEENTAQNQRGFRSHNLSLVVGDSGSESSSEDLQDMRSRMQSFAVNDNGGMPSSTIFVEDSDVILPSTSQTGFSSQFELGSSVPRLGDSQMPGIDMNSFVKDLFANDTRFLHTGREAETNFIEEILTEKQPKVLRNYLFGNVIGEGSYSKVKEVLHVKSLMRRAVKIIKDKRLRKIPSGEQNVQREVDVLQQLDHPNVVKVVDIFRIEEKQKLYIVMEYCVCSLQQMLDNCQEKMLPEFQAHLYFTQLLDGLDFLHSRRIIHKDIKPGNLLLSLDGVLKICDLGVAEMLRPESQGDWCTLVQGTPKFQPPEVVSGTRRRFRGSLVDIWASGVTLYNMVSGEYPFDGDVIMKLFENITNNPPKIPENVQLSAELGQLLHGMMQKEPDRRWDSLRIRASKWFSSKHQIDNFRIVHVPPIKNIPAHRPLGVFHCLEQMYGGDEETFVGEGGEGTDGHGQEDMTAFGGGQRQQMFGEGASSSSSHRQQKLDLSSASAAGGRAVKIELEEEEEDGEGQRGEGEWHPILGAAVANHPQSSEGGDCGVAGDSTDENNEINGDDGGQGPLRRERAAKISIARLRQILFIALCSLIVLASLVVLFLML